MTILRYRQVERKSNKVAKSISEKQIQGPRLDRNAFSIGSLADDSDDIKYWLERTPAERLEALEQTQQSCKATIHLPSDFKEFLKLPNSNQDEHLLVGGYAVVYHGYPRATADMDIWVDVNPQNAEKLAKF